MIMDGSALDLDEKARAAVATCSRLISSFAAMQAPSPVVVVIDEETEGGLGVAKMAAAEAGFALE